MWVSPDIINESIRTQHLTRLAVYDISEVNKYDYLEGTPEQLVKRIGDWVNTLSVPFLVKCWAEGMHNETGGRASDKRASFIWRLHGAGHQATGAPVPPVPTALPVPQGSTLTQADIDRAIAFERLKWERDRDVETLAALKAQIEVLSNAEDEEEDGEEDEEPVASGASEMAELRMLVELVLPVLGVKRGAIGSPGASDNATDAELLRAIARLERADPANAKMYKEQLLRAYGDAAFAKQPEDDGGGK